ncbi:MAG: 2-octaprenyl-6-methoxyphenyl hydroxylase [Marinomonas sp.]
MTADILIVGGGLVGASFALALASHNRELNICMVESIEASSESQPSFDDRSTVLSKSSANIFADMGIWPHLANLVAPIQHIHTSEKKQFGMSRLHATDYDVEAMGYVVDNKGLGTQLYSQLKAFSNVQILSPAKVTNLNAKADYYQASVLDLDSGVAADYQVKLVVMCDGGRSDLAKQLDLTHQVKTYDQAALIANIELQKPHQGWAYERFAKEGPIAMLPLPNFHGRDRSALVWTTSMSSLDERMALSDADFLSELQAEFGHRLGRFKAVGERAYYPLKIQKANEFVRSRLAILGNAAYTLHPVAGQGFNLALRGVALLAHNVLSSLAKGADIGALSNLNQFAIEQDKDAKRIQTASHGLVSVFAAQNLPIRFSRNLANLALDHCPLAKGSFARAAMGLDVHKPTIRI